MAARIVISFFIMLQFSSSFLEGIAEHVDPRVPFISLSKGLELNTLRMMSQIIPQSLGNPRQPFIALSGPSFAVELMRKLPTGTFFPPQLYGQACRKKSVFFFFFHETKLIIEAYGRGHLVSYMRIMILQLWW